MEKIKLCVIFGGQSPEHDISRLSVTSILQHLNLDKYEIYIIGITKNGAWRLYTGPLEKITDGAWQEDSEHLKKAIISPDAEERCIIIFDGDAVVKIQPDVVFPVLHGEHGEDGTIQGLLEMANMKYVGTGVAASANGMDKTFAKVLFRNAGIPQADWVVVKKGELDAMDQKLDEIEEKLGYPCFVKPAGTGSSVGISKAHDRKELRDGILLAAEYDSKILVEEYIEGHEVETGVLGNEHPKAGAVGEIIPTVEFYDFDAKYVDDSTEIQIPAKLPEETMEQIREYAVRAFQAIGGRGLSRVDFFVKYSDGSVILNEINTMPGFTSISMYPKSWETVGVPYGELLDRLIELGLE